EHSGISHRHSGSTQGHAGSQHGEAGSTHSERHQTGHEESQGSTRRAHSGLGQSPESSSHITPRRSPVHNESTEREHKSAISQRHSASTHNHAGSQHGELGSGHTQSHNIHQQSRDSVRSQSSSIRGQSGRRHFESQNNRKQSHGSVHRWRHGSYGRSEYDYGQSGYGPSGHSRSSSRTSSPLRSTDGPISTSVSTHGQSFSISDQTEFKATGREGRQVSMHGQFEASQGQLVDCQEQSGSRITRQGSSHAHSIITSEQSSNTNVQSQFGTIGNQGSIHSPSYDQSFSSTRKQSGFTNERQKYSQSQPSNTYEQSIDNITGSQRSFSNYSLYNQDPMGSEEYRYLSRNSTILGGGSQEQESGSDPSGGISRYSQDVDNTQTRGSEARDYHRKARMDSGSLYIDSSTPLYEYVQEQRCYYFE
ncbi:hypothetical protein H1C71_032235, partial [Ictidomys tridecemlineatus]